MGWKTIAHSAIGTKYAKIGKPCQDYTNYLSLGDIIIGVVSDGAGSAKYSHIGSKLAVETAISCLKELINYQHQLGYDWQKPTSQTQALKVIFTPTFEAVLKALKRNADQSNRGGFENADLAQYGVVTANNQASYTIKDLACTLLVFIATPEWLTAMQIGDGFIVIKQPNLDDYELIFPPDQEEYAGVTTFVTSKNALEKMRVRVIPSKQEFICISTDGLERLAIDFKNLKPHAPFFDPFKKGIEEDWQEENQSTKIWLNSSEVNERTDDDKTLLICLYEHQESSQSSNADTSVAPSFDDSISPSPNKHRNTKLELERSLPISILAGTLWNANHGLWINNINSLQTTIIVWVLIVSIMLFDIIFISRGINKRNGKNLKKGRGQSTIVRKMIFLHTIVMIVGIGIGILIYYLIWFFAKYF